jgi:hypothetical protein
VPTRSTFLSGLLYKAYSRLDVRYGQALLLILPVAESNAAAKARRNKSEASGGTLRGDERASGLGLVKYCHHV